MKYNNLNSLFEQLTLCCEAYKICPSWFNVGIHEDSLEIYTAEEHDEYQYHGSMGCECTTKKDVADFVKSVYRQNKYYKSKAND